MQLWLLTVVCPEMYLPFAIDRPETFGIKCLLSSWFRRTAWENQVRIAEGNICHYWTEGLCAVRLQHDQSQPSRGNWLCWESMEERSGACCQSSLLLHRLSLRLSSDPASHYAAGTVTKGAKLLMPYWMRWNRTTLISCHGTESSIKQTTSSLYMQIQHHKPGL